MGVIFPFGTDFIKPQPNATRIAAFAVTRFVPILYLKLLISRRVLLIRARPSLFGPVAGARYLCGSV
jgi:hypothetical protein